MNRKIKYGGVNIMISIISTFSYIAIIFSALVIFICVSEGLSSKHV